MTKRAEHALADPALLRTLAAEAGFTQIKIVTETRPSASPLSPPMCASR